MRLDIHGVFDLPLPRQPTLRPQAMKTLHLNVIGRGVELTVLDISNCKITSHGALHLAEFIVANRSLIELKVGTACAEPCVWLPAATPLPANCPGPSHREGLQVVGSAGEY